jgi:WhiB family redox-sensing transcriptional regulator
MTSAAIRLFFSDDVADINQAKRICAACPVAAPCLQGALDRHEPCGVWGGYLLANGQILAHKRPRGRPPKHRPAQDIIQQRGIATTAGR